MVAASNTIISRLCSIAQLSERRYPSSIRSNIRSEARNSRPGGFSPWGFSQRAQSIGVVVSDTSNETRIATDRVTANSRKSRPMMPPIRRMGINTAINEILIDSTVKPTSWAPCRAAANGFMPFSI